MEKILVSLILILSSSNLYAEVYLDCNMLQCNIRKDLKDQFSEIEYNTLKPSNFSAIIEYTGPSQSLWGKVVKY